MDENGDDSKGAAQRQRPGIPHKDLGGMTIEPKEAESGANNRGAEYGKFPRPPYVRNVEVTGAAKVAGKISEYQKHERDEKRASNGQPVQSVRKVDRIGAAYNSEHREDQSRQTGAGKDRMLIKRHHDLGHQLAGGRGW